MSLVVGNVFLNENVQINMCYTNPFTYLSLRDMIREILLYRGIQLLIIITY